MRKLGAQLSKITMEMRPVEMRPVVTRDKQCGGACSYVVARVLEQQRVHSADSGPRGRLRVEYGFVRSRARNRLRSENQVTPPIIRQEFKKILARVVRLRLKWRLALSWAGCRGVQSALILLPAWQYRSADILSRLCSRVLRANLCSVL